jgi:uncharacterized surface protein with fasciclin (FAS1) repeats
MNDILSMLDAEGNFKTVLALLDLAGLADRLRKPGHYTFFAPNDTAFERVNIKEISRDPDSLRTLLLYHLVEGEYGSGEIAENEHLLTEAGKSLSVSREEGQLVIDNAKLITADIKCANGIIHVIDNVFLPQFSGWYCGGCC